MLIVHVLCTYTHLVAQLLSVYIHDAVSTWSLPLIPISQVVTLVRLLLWVDLVCPWPTSKATFLPGAITFPLQVTSGLEKALRAYHFPLPLHQGTCGPERLDSRIFRAEVSGSARPCVGQRAALGAMCLWTPLERYLLNFTGMFQVL